MFCLPLQRSFVFCGECVSIQLIQGNFFLMLQHLHLLPSFHFLIFQTLPEMKTKYNQNDIFDRM